MLGGNCVMANLTHQQCDALRRLNSNVVNIWGDQASDKDGNTINVIEADVDAEYAKQNYKNQRMIEYPSIEDQLDLMYHSGFDAWKTKIKETKDKYPKPS